MTKNHIKTSIVILIVFCTSCLSYSQEFPSFELIYEVNKTYPPFSISEEKLDQLETLIDINPRFESSWIEEYIQVELSTIHNGKTLTAIGINDTLTEKQKKIIRTADSNKEFTVLVKYIPNNTLKQKEIKELNFNFKLDPAIDASFPGGELLLTRYIKENIIDKTPVKVYKKHKLNIITFSIDEQGRVIDALVLASSLDTKVEKTLVEAICNMPKWSPAEYTNGVKIKQDFALTVGDRYSCTMNLINIKNPN